MLGVFEEQQRGHGYGVEGGDRWNGLESALGFLGHGRNLRFYSE